MYDPKRAKKAQLGVTGYLLLVIRVGWMIPSFYNSPWMKYKNGFYFSETINK